MQEIRVAFFVVRSFLPKVQYYVVKPRVGREDGFVEGVVQGLIGDFEFKSFKIRITKHAFAGKEFTEMGYTDLGNRVGQTMYVPMELVYNTDFPDYDSRIINLSS